MQEAVMRLRSAKELGHSEIGIINALGDTFLALAELLPSGEERSQALRQAQEEGFGAAMLIDRRNPDALIGAAEVEMLMGRGICLTFLNFLKILELSRLFQICVDDSVQHFYLSVDI